MGDTQFTFRPLTSFPVPMTKGRKRAPFSVGHSKIMADLKRELGHLQAYSVCISLALSSSDLRLDNTPRAGANPQHPGVVLSWESKKTGSASMPCDTYLNWLDNLRAISLALTALRAVDRYGVTRNSEQYRGWRPELPPPPGQEPSMPLTPEGVAREFLALCQAGPLPVVQNVEAFKAAYREGVKKHHPDRNDGRDLPEWHRLQRAAGVLKKHHGIA